MILGFDSAGKSVSAAVYDEKNNICLAKRFNIGTGTHSVTLLPMIDGVLSESSLKMSDISLIAVTVGPGSFTGVRIGVSLAKGLAISSDIPVCAVSSMEAAALGVLSCASDGDVILSVSDARRERFYNAAFTVKNGSLARLYDDCVLHYTDICNKVYGNVIIIGDGAELFISLADNARFSKAENIFTDAENVCKAAKKGEKTSSDKLLPVYLGLSQAERELKEKSAK
ncbi:MAG: tRNA (adenosine(37)-N6)-threonylcarbamoyltransferase complex dimerization subunit type 1 TsaB [Clostridia bacterium]|nr:tRNA (adenosine(37)-N6)-threonylcarbamoyltransferase complex dimerization subunit type 1 TsaB [Clostridia bacterium]